LTEKAANLSQNYLNSLPDSALPPVNYLAFAAILQESKMNSFLAL